MTDRFLSLQKRLTHCCVKCQNVVKDPKTEKDDDDDDDVAICLGISSEQWEYKSKALDLSQSKNGHLCSQERI